MFTFTVRQRAEGIGWEIKITVTSTGFTFTTDPIYDPTILVAEVSRLTTRMALGREA